MTQVQQPGEILIVDDNDLNLDLLESALLVDKHTVYAASSGDEALKKLETIQPELIILDINMPRMSGYELCERIKARPETADTPVMFISALGDSDHVVHGFDVGAVDYITKPFEYREVLARVSGQLALYRHQQAIIEQQEKDRKQFEMIDQMRQQFIGGATHDLKNPLFIIAGYVDVLESIDHIAADQEAMEYIGSIKRGADKMSVLIGDMLDLLEIDKGVVLKTETVPLGQFLDDALHDMKHRAEEKSIKLLLNDVDASWKVSIDQERMGRVIDNLLSNAIKYTPSGGHIAVSVAADDHSIQIHVDDDGYGIPDDVLPDLFQPFQRVQTKEHMAEEGTGLGLSIVQALVEQHGGQILVESVYGEGSRFTVQLPRMK